jgi:16S rRNA (guanine527-N7)-methyltransferase
MSSISQAQIEDAFRPYGIAYSQQLVESIRIYVELLLKWNRTVSLTTVTDLDAILRFHFGESLFALRMLPVEKGRLADVGTGAGFPGLPLAIASPNLQVTLIESNAKKSAFLNEVVRALALQNATVVRSRMEEFRETEECLDIVTSRALGQFTGFLRWSRRSLRSNGRVLLWVGERDAAVISSDKDFTWEAPISIPGSTRRVILIGCPNR